MFVFADSVVFILFSEFIMSWIIMSKKNIKIKDMINSEKIYNMTSQLLSNFKELLASSSQIHKNVI